MPTGMPSVKTIFNLPVHQPADRTKWHRKELFHDEGHPIHQAGLRIDDYFRPIDTQGRCVYPTLFAAGSILAHQDWIRQKMRQRPGHRQRLCRRAGLPDRIGTIPSGRYRMIMASMIRDLQHFDIHPIRKVVC